MEKAPLTYEVYVSLDEPRAEASLLGSTEDFKEAQILGKTPRKELAVTIIEKNPNETRYAHPYNVWGRQADKSWLQICKA